MISAIHTSAGSNERAVGADVESSEPTAVEALSREDIFDILSNHRRRYVLRYLQEHEAESDLRTLSEQIAAWENEVDPSQVTSKQRMRAYTALRQSHLPKMDRQGVIDFDSQSGTVHLTEAAHAIEGYLDSVDSERRPWGTYFLGAGILGLLVSLGCFFDLFLLGMIPDAVAGIVVSVVVLAGGLAEVRDGNRGTDLVEERPVTEN